MSVFQNYYKDMVMPSLPLFGLGELVVYAGFRWEITGFKPNKEEGCWVYNLKRVDGTDETESDINELGLMKSYRAEKSIDPDLDEKMKAYLQKLGIANAGPVPNSLLAAQDLEGVYETKSFSKGTDLNNFAVWYYDKGGARKCAVFGKYIEAAAFARLVDSMGYKDVSILKGQVEITGKELEDAASKAEDAKTSETKSLIENIKAIQLRRQKATINARSQEKSFKSAWTKLNN